MQLPSVPRMLVFAACILVLGLGGVLIALGGAFADFLGALANVFVDKAQQAPAATPTTVVQQSSIGLVIPATWYAIANRNRRS